MAHSRPFEIRDPIHGFISLNAWECDTINHPAFQRLRRLFEALHNGPTPSDKLQTLETVRIIEGKE
jgi:hypothetical protein